MNTIDDHDAKPAPGPTPTQHIDSQRHQRLTRLAWLLDRSIPLPGGFRIGLDGLVGLIPGIGDLATSAVSSYIVLEASRMGVPAAILLRMAMNIAVESVIGLIPVVGDIFDFAWKANVKNVQLLDEHLRSPRPVQVESRWLVAAVLIGLGLFLALVLALAFALLRALFG